MILPVVIFCFKGYSYALRRRLSQLPGLETSTPSLLHPCRNAPPSHPSPAVIPSTPSPASHKHPPSHTQMDLIYRGINSSGPERRLFLESRDTSCRPSSLPETRREGGACLWARWAPRMVSSHPLFSRPNALQPLQALTWQCGAPSCGPGQAGHLDIGWALNLDSPRAPEHSFPHPLPPAVPTGCQGSTHSSN